jgi:hypothetical protein
LTSPEKSGIIFILPVKPGNMNNRVKEVQMCDETCSSVGRRYQAKTTRL